MKEKLISLVVAILGIISAFIAKANFDAVSQGDVNPALVGMYLGSGIGATLFSIIIVISFLLLLYARIAKGKEVSQDNAEGKENVSDETESKEEESGNKEV